MNIETIIRNERIRRGWDQTKFGFFCDMPPQHISTIERALEPCGKRRQQRIANILGMTIEEIFNEGGYARLFSETL
jgi:transcriptional regulator with XRE-family HTH domain